MFGAVQHRHASLPSTQQSALAAAADALHPAGEGEVWVADAQTAGRGRHGHAWTSPPGEGLYFSLVLRPQGSAAGLPPLTLLAGLAVADAVVETCGVDPDIRWPNDLLLAGRKFAGLLVETSSDGDGVQYAVLGVGINVHQRSFPPDLEFIATSLALQGALEPSRSALLAACLRSLEARYVDFQRQGPASTLVEFERRSSYARGLAVTVGDQRGVTEGLDAVGFLRLRLADGGMHTVVSGDVRPAVS